MRTQILGVGFDNVTMDEAVAFAREAMADHRSVYGVTPNPEIVWDCRENPALAEAVSQAALVLPDGIGIIYGARILGTPLKGRVPGIDFAETLMREMGKQGQSVFLFGAKPGVAELAAQELLRRCPGLVIAGTHDGYFTDDAPIAEAIRTAKPDLTLVCLGSPKQELWMAKYAGTLDTGLMLGLGGSLDVFAGTVRRAPVGWQKLGLEWLYRLIREPRRIGRMMRLPRFLLAVIWLRLRGKHDAG